MKSNKKLIKRCMSIILSIALLMTGVPNTLLVASADTTTAAETVADPGTAHTWETMLGTGADGNRYAGRVWVDKSVYTDGQEAMLTTSGATGSKFKVELGEDEDFQVIFSALGSSMTSTTTTTSSGPMDVVLILDNSISMNETSNRITRMQRVIEAANGLISKLLSGMDVRLGITSYGRTADTILPFGKYTNGVVLSVNNYSNGGVVSARDNSNVLLGSSDNGYEMYTNTQAGFDLGMSMLESASDTSGRTPIVILLTDGAANTAVDKSFYDISEGTSRQVYYSNDIHAGIALSTLLSASYKKASVGDHYGKTPMVYGIGVDLSTTDGSNAIINPKENFNASNRNQNIRSAYSYYNDEWAEGENVTIRNGQYSFVFDHNYPAGSTITDSDVIANINYVDTYYNVQTGIDELEDTFTQIYEELSSGAFNPISSTTTVEGSTVENTPLIYVDNIGQHMEIKNIQAITLFGASYGVVNKGNGNYTVQGISGTNPTTKEEYNADDIRITVIENTDGTQKLEIRINQEILPITLEQVTDKTVSGANSATIMEMSYSPLRVYYTVGLDSDVLLPNGEIDISKIDSKYIDKDTGKITLYSNVIGGMNNTDSDANGFIDNGDTHVGFKPSATNRYYYHQENHGIFTQITSKSDGSTVNIPENNTYGIVWDEDAYELTWMDYNTYKTMGDDSKVYTYVTYYRPTESTTDADNAAEKVTYLVYADWGYLKESVAFYDATTGKYVNYDSNSETYSLDDVGRVVDPTHIEAYVASNPNAEIYAVLGVGSLRTSRFHNMISEKSENKSGTADNRYVPEYTHNTPGDTNNHYGNDVVVWLGNNGKFTQTINTGIVLKKAVTEAIGSTEDTYELTVTVENTTAYPVVKDINGNVFGTTDPGDNDKVAYDNNVLKVKLKAGESVYISGIPAGTNCTVGEVIPDNAEYHIEGNATRTVKVPTIAEILAETNPVAQYVDATVTNAPNKYGDLTIVKDISYTGTLTSEMQSALAAKDFTFTVDVGTALKGKSFDTYNTAGVKNDTGVTVDDNGKFAVILKDNESITIKDLPEGTAYTVTETNKNGLTLTNSVGESVTDHVVSGTIASNDDDTAHFVNTYNAPTVSVAIDVSGTKTLLGTSYDAQVFDFEVQKWNGSAYETIAKTDVENGDRAIISVWQAGERASDTYSIGLNLTDLTLGTHYYRVVEVVPTPSVVGMTYDSTEGRFRATVTDNDVNGVAEVLVEKYDEVNDTWSPVSNVDNAPYSIIKHFVNTYDVENASVTIPVIKKLTNDTGVDIGKDIFSFKLVEVEWDATNATYKEKEGPTPFTVHADAGGNAIFQITELKQTGTYYYYLTENIPATPMVGMTYDTSTYLVTVTVSKESESSNVLKASYTASIVGGNELAESIVFNNKYELTPATWTPEVTKNLNGRELKNDEFEFALYETDSSFVITDNSLVETVKNVGNTFNFDEITYSKVGNYYYSIKEIAGTVPGVTYDTTHYHVTVTVGIDSTDETKLAITNISMNKIGTNSDTSGKIAFVNEYRATPAEYIISGTKTLTGRAMAADEFSFELYEEGSSTPIETVTNKVDGSFTFSAIEYKKPGEFKYTIKEVKGDESRGVTYNGAEHPIEVTITVVNNVNTTDNTVSLIASTDKNNTEIAFENTYTAAATSVPLTAKKILKGETLTENAFDVELYETDHTFTVSDGSVRLALIGNDASGNFNFVDNNNENLLKYETPGTHFYVLREVPGSRADMVYDSTDYQIRVVVSDNGAGNLVADVACYNGELGNLTFTNATFDEVTEKEVYAGTTSTEIDGTKVNVGDILTYYISYTNYTGKNVVVDILDTIPAHTSYVEGSATHNGTYAGTHLNWVLNVLKGERVTVSFKVKVEESEVIMKNTAIILDGVNTYTTNEVINHTVEDVVQKDVFNTSDITTSIDGKSVNVGDELLYTISYTNASSGAADITITDKLPEHTICVENSADNGGVYADGTVTWNIDGVPAWSTVTVSFKVKVDAVANTIVIANKADIKVGTNTYTTNEVTNDVVYEPDPTPSQKPEVTPTPDPNPTPTPPVVPEEPEPESQDEHKIHIFTKVWDDNNNAAGKRPSSVMVSLYCDGIYASDIELCEANNWTCGLILMSINDGKEVVWTIEEKNVPAGYTASYNQETHTVTNTYIGSLDADSTRTGDDSNIALFGVIAVIALIALAGIALLIFKFKKKEEHEE